MKCVAPFYRLTGIQTGPAQLPGHLTLFIQGFGFFGTDPSGFCSPKLVAHFMSLAETPNPMSHNQTLFAETNTSRVSPSSISPEPVDQQKN